MVSTATQPARAQASATESLVTVSYAIDGILDRASDHYMPPAYCGHEPKDHKIDQHKAEFMEIPSMLEAILRKPNISDNDRRVVSGLMNFAQCYTTDPPMNCGTK